MLMSCRRKSCPHHTAMTGMETVIRNFCFKTDTTTQTPSFLHHHTPTRYLVQAQRSPTDSILSVG
ncbi:MAG: hypothetical protein ACJAYE_003367 [Candidatus Azotimanducaceae bacterium]|jgi:hypothetical protein